MMTNLLQDLLPDAPREAGILTTAAQKNVAGRLRDHLANGLDAATAVRLTAATLASSTAFAPEACQWATLEFAVAMGMLSAATAISTLPPTGPNAVNLAPAAGPTTAPHPETELPQTVLPLIAGGIPGRVEAAALGQQEADARGLIYAGYGQAGMPYPDRTDRQRRKPFTATMVTIILVAVVAVAGVIGYQLAGSTPTSRASHSSSNSPRANPTPSRTSSPVTAPGTGWIAQLASVAQPTSTVKLDQALARIRTSVPGAMVLNSTDYASLRPGYWVIYYRGNFANGTQALAYCAAHGFATARQCIGRYLSHSDADLAYQCYPPAPSPSGDCYHSPDPKSP